MAPVFGGTNSISRKPPCPPSPPLPPPLISLERYDVIILFTLGLFALIDELRISLLHVAVLTVV